MRQSSPLLEYTSAEGIFFFNATVENYAQQVAGSEYPGLDFHLLFT
jgi:hypothetical protein